MAVVAFSFLLFLELFIRLLMLINECLIALMVLDTNSILGKFFFR